MDITLTDREVQTLARALAIASIVLEGEFGKRDMDVMLARFPLTDGQLEGIYGEVSEVLDRVIVEK
jgi:hypothetical protein